jgi:hypothetical protein
MAVSAIGIETPSYDKADASPAPALAIRQFPCGMYSGFDVKRDCSLVARRFGCQSLSGIR